MAEQHISIRSQSQKIQIEPTEISGNGGAENPTLIVPLKIIVNPIKLSGNKKQPFNLMGVDASISFNGLNYKTSKTIKFNYHKINYDNTIYYALDFQLDNYKLSKIEEKRIENIRVQIDLTLHIGHYESIVLNTGNINNPTTERDFISDFDYVSANISVEIPHSHWVSKVLPAMGYNSVRIIEIPSASTLLVEELNNSLKELNIANEYYLKGDYDKTVAHCRSAIDPIKRKLPDLKNAIQSSVEKDWVTKITEATESWLDVMVKQTFNFTSKAHHIPSVGHFSRADAEIIYMITMGIVAYAGKLNPEKYKQKK